MSRTSSTDRRCRRARLGFALAPIAALAMNACDAPTRSVTAAPLAVDAAPATRSSASSPTAVLGASPVGLAAMAPLTIGRLDAPDDPAGESEWTAFSKDLLAAKGLGITTISVDIWWGSVEAAGDQQFDFRWVDRTFGAIVSAGLDIRPVLAFHACGTNVGDTCSIPIPTWLFDRYRGQGSPDGGVIAAPEDLGYVSAQGHPCHEVISAWATPIVLNQYVELFRAFAERYAPIAEHIRGIAVGLGPASELRYPSYDAHDVGSGYPGPGVVQASSTLAIASFRRAMLAKHGDVAGVAAAWGMSPSAAAAVDVPTLSELEAMYSSGGHITTQRGRDFFDWYRASLFEHGRAILGAAADVFQASALRGKRLSVRVPGVHWRAGDTRLAELSAGLLATSEAVSWSTDDTGHGYAPLARMVADLRARPDTPNFAIEYTCLEKGNGEGGPAVASRAEDLVFWVASAAHRAGVPIGGENALASGLHTDFGWGRIRNALQWSHYDELTLLRVHDVVTAPQARSNVADIARRGR